MRSVTKLPRIARQSRAGSGACYRADIVAGLVGSGEASADTAEEGEFSGQGGLDLSAVPDVDVRTRSPKSSSAVGSYPLAA